MLSRIITLTYNYNNIYLRICELFRFKIILIEINLKNTFFTFLIFYISYFNHCYVKSRKVMF